MTQAADLPLWAALPVAILMVAGATLGLIGSLGLIRLRSFYDRIHAPTLGTSWGAAAILIASLLSWSWLQDRAVVHEVVIGVFLLITTPVTMMLLGRTALVRDRAKGGEPDVPPPAGNGSD